MHWFMTLWNQANYGIEGLHMYTIEHYHLQAKQYQAYLKFKQNIKELEKYVRKGRM